MPVKTQNTLTPSFRQSLEGTSVASASWVEASAAQTAAQDYDFVNAEGFKTAHIIIDITAAGTPVTDTITFDVQGKDPASGKYYSILTSAALDATGTTVLKIIPGVAAVANEAISDKVPSEFRISTTKNTGVSFTYSIGVDLS